MTDKLSPGEGPPRTTLQAAASRKTVTELATSKAHSRTSIIQFRPNDILADQGETCAGVYELIEGTVLLSRRLHDGRRQIIELLGAGTLLGTPSEGPLSARVEAVTKVRARIHAMQAFERSPDLQMRAIAQLGQRVATIHELALTLGRRTARERIAAYLLQLSRADRPLSTVESRPRGHAFGLSLTQTDLADHLGLSIETVCREIARLKRDGTIALSSRGELTLHDPATLAATAEVGQSPALRRASVPKLHRGCRHRNPSQEAPIAGAP